MPLSLSTLTIDQLSTLTLAQLAALTIDPVILLDATGHQTFGVNPLSRTISAGRLNRSAGIKSLTRTHFAPLIRTPFVNKQEKTENINRIG